MCLFIYNGHGLCEVTEDGLSEMETKRKVPVRRCGSNWFWIFVNHCIRPNASYFESPYYALWGWRYLKAFCYDNSSKGSHSLKERQSLRSGYLPDGELPMLPNHSHVRGCPMTVSYYTFPHVHESSVDTHTYPPLFPMLALQFRQKKPYYTSFHWCRFAQLVYIRTQVLCFSLCF